MGRVGLGLAAGLALATASAAAPATAQEIAHTGAPTAAIATSVTVPPGATTVYVSGLTPDPADPAAPEASPARYGDTEAQARSVFRKIVAALAAQGMAPGDVVMMRVYLVAPPGTDRMDFAGMMTAYRELWGTAAQPAKPARLTVQVSGLVDPRFLVEVEATAAKLAR